MVLNLWSTDHQWSAAICLVVREQRLLYILQGYYKHKQTNFGTIFSGGPQLRDKMCKWFLSLKWLSTVALACAEVPINYSQSQP